MQGTTEESTQVNSSKHTLQCTQKWDNMPLNSAKTRHAKFVEHTKYNEIAFVHFVNFRNKLPVVVSSSKVVRLRIDFIWRQCTALVDSLDQRYKCVRVTCREWW